MDSNDLCGLAVQREWSRTVIINHVLGFNNESFDGCQFWTRSILKLHLNMIDPPINKPPFIIECRIQSDNKTNIMRREVMQNMAEGARQRTT